MERITSAIAFKSEPPKIYRLLSDLFALGERSLKLPDVVLPPDLMGMMWSMFLPLRLMFSLSYKRLAFWRSS